MTHAADLAHLRRCVSLASSAARRGEVPVGALVVSPAGAPLRGSSNRSARDALAHAEVLALRGAARALGVRRLDGCTLYVSLEPCFMCLGAALAHHVARVVFAARSAKFGALTTGAAATAEAAVPRGPCAACGTAQPPVSPRILRSAPRTLLLECAEDAHCLRPAAAASANLLRAFLGGLRGGQLEAKCKRCAAPLECSGGDDCWCFDPALPRLPVPRAGGGAGCVCPQCLREEARGKGHL
jgi:tRNA(Arg) A34 adenosine deaminase TadA